jgi:hypothetical protein
MSTSSFTNAFPLPSIFDFFASNEYNEIRRSRLEEWLRELCLNEKCMTTRAITSNLYLFIKANENGGPAGLDSQPHVTVHFRRYTPPSNEIVLFPIDYDEFTSHLPFHVRADAFSGAMTELISDAQLVKDMERDRVVIQGRRIVGSHTKFPAILSAAVDAVAGLLLNAVQSGAISQTARNVVSEDNMRIWCLECLKRASRTDAASQCHSALMRLIVLRDAVIVPESTLAKPIELFFFLRVKQSPEHPSRPYKRIETACGSPPSHSFSIACDVRNTTVYRIADMETLTTVLQLAGTYYCMLTGLVVVEGHVTTSPSLGDTLLVFERETKTTSRDW